LHFATETVSLPELTPAETSGMEYAMTGVSTGTHPLLFYRAALQQRGILSTADLTRYATGEQVRTA
jgi:error-prone DNA polymerase